MICNNDQVQKINAHFIILRAAKTPLIELLPNILQNMRVGYRKLLNLNCVLVYALSRWSAPFPLTFCLKKLYMHEMYQE